MSDSIKGYNPTFIGQGKFECPFPKFSPKLQGAVLKGNELRNEIYLDYEHYTVVMNKTTRQLIYAASNIDQKEAITVIRKQSKGWDTDSRIADTYQLDNRYYKNNDWDRGHMVQRENNCWGKDFGQALLANNDTFFYTNAAFQHKYFNQDEWLKLEKFIGHWTEDTTDKLCVFTGPVHFPFDRQYARTWHDTVRIPSAFFKIVCYEANGEFQTRAFMLYQDNEFIGNKKKGAGAIKLVNYQVSVTEIMELTGIEFDQKIVQSNPLYYAPEQLEDPNLVINSFPERIPVDSVEDVVSSYTKTRVTQEAKEEDKTVAIAAAMVNPTGRDEIMNEWITILNISNNEVILDGWKLEDHKGRTIPLEGILEDGNSKKIFIKDYKTIRLPNTGGTIILKNDKNEVVDRESYVAAETKVENKAIRF